MEEFSNPKNKQENPSIIDRMLLDKEHFDRLPTPEKILTDIEQALSVGTSEAAELIRSAGVLGNIQKESSKILLLEKTGVLAYLNVMKIHHGNEDLILNEQLEKIIKEYETMLGEFHIKDEKMRILLDPIEIIERNNFARMRLLTTIAHETLHKLSAREQIPWLDEAITERLTHGVVRDVEKYSDEWNKSNESLDADEVDQITLESYSAERAALADLVEEMIEKCSKYKNLPNSNFKERNANERMVFIENFGNSYFSGVYSLLEENLRELGYESVVDLAKLDPNI